MRFASLSASLIAAAFLAACSSQPQVGAEQTPAEVKDATATAKGTGAGADAGISSTGLAALKDPNNILSKRAVYFDYDSYIVKNEFLPLLEAHAKFLKANPQDRILIQGNADERGSREYNLALGQKRAEAVKKSLLMYGAGEAQVESVSLGKEKPVCEESTEDCWAKNRRGDMLHALAKEF